MDKYFPATAAHCDSHELIKFLEENEAGRFGLEPWRRVPREYASGSPSNNASFPEKKKRKDCHLSMHASIAQTLTSLADFHGGQTKDGHTYGFLQMSCSRNLMNGLVVFYSSFSEIKYIHA